MSRNIPTADNVTVIPALSPTEIKERKYKQVRVAAYCRVSTDHEEQQNSYQVQIAYYTDLINSNPEWTLAGIFADEGISGTQTKNRTQFNKMIRKCKQKKIDLVLCKSISRFARNTVDCLEYIRELKLLGIGVMFEKENISTMTMNSEFIISLYGSFAQAESESISKNVTWGVEKSFKEGKVKYSLDKMLGYSRGDDGKPVVVEEEAETVRYIYKLYLDGLSLKRIARKLRDEGIKKWNGTTDWTAVTVYGILKNEKYAGDAVLQKTYTVDCILHKQVKNNGEKDKYIVYDCHPAIVSRDTYNRVQQELARRGSIRKRSDKTETEQGHYASKYALSDILICGECGTAYRRVTWTSHGHKLVVWRCISRLDHGNRYCKNSPSINEEKLQSAIVDALNRVYADGEKLMEEMKRNLMLVMTDKDIAKTEIDKMEMRLREIAKARKGLVSLITSGAVDEDSLDKDFEDLINEERFLKEQISDRKTKSKLSDEKRYHLMSAFEELQKAKFQMTEYDDVTVRKVIECIRVLSKTEVQIVFKGGFEMNVEVDR